MSDKITLDRETFKVLAADTRVDILKKLAEHKLTLTDLAQEMNMSPSTIKEHLDRLVDVGLIEQVDRGMKWKYYRLTDKGRNILSPYETKVWILLGTSLLVLAGSALSLAGRLAGLIAPGVMKAAASELERGDGALRYAADEAFNESAELMADSVSKAAEYTASVVQEAVNESASLTAGAAPPSTVVEGAAKALTAAHAGAAAQMPYLELALLVASLVAVGFSAGYLIKKRVKIV